MYKDVQSRIKELEESIMWAEGYNDQMEDDLDNKATKAQYNYNLKKIEEYKDELLFLTQIKSKE